MATFGATFGETLATFGENLATLGSTLNTFLATFGYKLSYFGVAFGRKLGNFLFQHWVTPKETGKSIKSILCHILDDDIIMVTHISSSQSTGPSSSMFDHLLHILWSLHLLWPLVFSSMFDHLLHILWSSLLWISLLFFDFIHIWSSLLWSFLLFFDFLILIS